MLIQIYVTIFVHYRRESCLHHGSGQSVRQEFIRQISKLASKPWTDAQNSDYIISQVVAKDSTRFCTSD